MALSFTQNRLFKYLTWVDLCILGALALFIYWIVGTAKVWTSPYRPSVEIYLDLGHLIWYSLLSLARVFAAYLISLGFTLVYGYVAAKSKVAEPILISILDILQSVPVLGFMPGLILALVALFPHSNLGLELAAILMIFTGQGWNMVFSFYSSLKTVPNDLRETASLYGLNRLGVLKAIEIPYAINGLIWNSMVSMAGGWFFLMVIESFSLGTQSFRLPGLGAYMATAYDAGDYTSVCLGLVMMLFLIVVVDRILWAPLVVWSQRFRMDCASEPESDSMVLEWLKRSRFLPKYLGVLESFANQLIELGKLPQPLKKMSDQVRIHYAVPMRRYRSWIYKGLGLFIFCYVLYKAAHATWYLVAESSGHTWLIHIRNTFLTWIRVMLAVILGSLWTVPLGIFIGTHPKWRKRMQPIVQVVASFPAPMLFPIFVGIFVKMHLSLEIGAVFLMMTASQWYILFNVISGATLIPASFSEISDNYRLKGLQAWKNIWIPAVFPSLVNGWITAAGGAWNACIVSEISFYGEVKYSATGIGASITEAALLGDFSALASGILVMVTTVVVLNRMFWGPMYRLAENRFRFDGTN